MFISIHKLILSGIEPNHSLIFHLLRFSSTQHLRYSPLQMRPSLVMACLHISQLLAFLNGFSLKVCVWTPSSSSGWGRKRKEDRVIKMESAELMPAGLQPIKTHLEFSSDALYSSMAQWGGWSQIVFGFSWPVLLYLCYLLFFFSFFTLAATFLPFLHFIPS